MDFIPTPLAGAFLVKSIVHRDDRGFFARARCSDEFEQHGLPTGFVQTDLSFNLATGTFRGLHFQVPPSSEGKLVRCIQGEIHDLIVDLRPDSPTFLRHEWFRLSASELKALFVPAGFAHGFLTAAEDTMILYEMSDYYSPQLSRGVRWNDSALGIRLPGEIQVISDRDATFADLQASQFECFRRTVS